MKNLLLLIGALFISAFSFSQIEEIYDSNAEEKLLATNGKLILVDFYATWCGPCKRMDPILKEIEQKYRGDLLIYKIDVDQNEVDDALGVTAMPTYYLIRDAETLETFEGARPKEEVETILAKYIDVPSYSTPSASSAITNSSGDTFPSIETTNDEYTAQKIAAIWNDWGELNTLAWHTFLEHNDVRDLIKAMELIKRSIALEENSFNTDTYAALLYKTGNFEDALDWAKKAVDLANAEGKDPSSTKQLMQLIIQAM